LACSYTVNPDCTGSFVLEGGGGNYSIVVAPDGSKVNWIETDTGNLFSGTELRIAADGSDAMCPLQNATLRGTYMVNGGGTTLGVGPVSAVGVITYDGKGNSANTFTASADGTIFSEVTVTGPCTVNSDCTGSLAQSDGTHYNFVVAADGSTVYWIETDTGNVITGTEVQFRPSGGLTQ
jgi:hypothetical protein